MARLVSRDCVIDIELRDEIITIGRSSTNAICLRAPGISKVHAKIEPCPEGFRLCDLDSTNGTLVNGAQVKDIVLRDRDVVKLGAEVLLFLADGKDVSESQVLQVFESAEKPPEEEKEEDDDEFLWGADEIPARPEAAGTVAAVEGGAPEPRPPGEVEWRPPWKPLERREPEEEEEVELSLPEGEFALVGEIRPQEDFRAEVFHMEQQLRVRRFLVTMLWLTASLMLHLQILLILRNVTLYSSSRPAPRIIVMNTRIEDALEREKLPPPPKAEEAPPSVTNAAPQQIAAEKIANVTKDVALLPPPDVKDIEIEGPLAPPRPRQEAALAPSLLGKGPGSGSVAALVTSEKPETQQEMLDDLAREMVEVLHKEFLHTIILIDESRSIDKDREWIRNRLEGLIKEVYLHLKPREVPGLKWSVSSFGKISHLEQTPTTKVEDVRKAITRAPFDDTGIENTVAALQFCMRNLRIAFATPNFSTFVIVITDERGDDTLNDRLLEETIENLKRNKTRVYVFGRESNFSTGTIKEPYRDPKSGQMVQVETDVGPETPAPEFFAPDELFFRTDTMRAGFGMYGLARIADATKGRYYFLNPGPDLYDPVRLEQYAPDLCSRKDYAERIARFAARQKILSVVREWDKVRPEQRVQTANVMTMVPFYMNKVDKAMAYCTEGIAALKPMQFKKGLEPHNMRWEAHRDLVLAELYKFKFMLEEYKAGFKALGKVPLSVNGGPLNGFQATLNPGGGSGANPASRKLFESALAQFKLVMEKHAKTPWAGIAENEMKTMGSISVAPTYMPSAEERREEKERKQPPRPPEPPKV